MTFSRNTAEGGTDGTVVTTANTGGASGDALYSVTISAGTNITFSSAQAYQGSLSYLLTATSAASVRFGQRGGDPTKTKGWRVRFYAYFTGYPTVTAQFIQVIPTTSGIVGYMHFTTAGKIALLNFSGATVWTSTDSVPLNTWVRIELIMHTGTGTTDGSVAALWAVGNSAALSQNTFSQTNGDWSSGLLIDRANFGKVNTAGTWSGVYYDEITADSSTSMTFIGPLASSAISNARMGSNILTNAYFGSATVSQMYIGSTQIFP